MGVPLEWFFDQWVRGSEIPTYHVAWSSQPADSGKTRIRLRITQEHVSADFHQPVLVSADLGGNRIARFRVDVNGRQTEYQHRRRDSDPQRPPRRVMPSRRPFLKPAVALRAHSGVLSPRYSTIPSRSLMAFSDSWLRREASRTKVSG